MRDNNITTESFCRYRKEDAENYNYVDVLPPGASAFEVQDLKVGTKYSFSIMAFNSIGTSEYTKDIGKVETKSKDSFGRRYTWSFLVEGDNEVDQPKW